MILKAIKNLLVGIIMGLFIIATIALTVSIKYGDNIAHYVVDQIQKKYSKTPIKIDEIHFTFFKHFPFATIEFKNVFVKSPDDFNYGDKQFSTDTLFYVQNMYLQLNLFDLLNKKYILKNINLAKGKICLFTNEKGEVNYKFWKSSNSSAEKDSFRINLQKVTLSDVEIIFINKAKNQTVSGYAQEIGLMGDFSTENYSLHTHARIFLQTVRMNKISYVKNKQVNVFADMDVVKDKFTLTKGDVSFSKMDFILSGSFTTGKEVFVNLDIGGKNLDIASLLNIMPDHYVKKIENYSSEGELIFKARIKGKITKFLHPHIEVSFGVKNASIHKNKSDFGISDIKIDGSFTNGNNNSDETSVLILKDFEFNLGKSNVAGMGKLNDFRKFNFTSKLNATIYLSEVYKFFDIDTLEYSDGKIMTNLQLKGVLPLGEKITRKDFSDWNIKGEAVFDQVNFKIKQSSKEFKNLNGKIQIDNDIYFSQFTCNLADNDFNITGMLGNGLNYFLKDSEELTFNAEIISKKINYETLESFFGSNNIKQDQSEGFKLVFPERINFNVKLDIDQFIYKKFNSNNILGTLTYKPKMFILKGVLIHTMDGTMIGNGAVIQQMNNNFLAQIQVSLNHINIQKMFWSFDNFGQKYLIDENLKGNITGDINFSSVWKSDLSVMKDKIAVESNIEIKDGELLNYKPMMSLAKYIDVSELVDIKFSNLKNTIFIKDCKVILPQMDITSSAINLSLSGTHTFDNDIDYHIKVALSEVLFKKAKKARKEKEDFSVEEEESKGKMNLYFVISGPIENPTIKTDKRKTREAFVTNISNEKKDLKKILNEEYGWFKKDSSSYNQPEISNKHIKKTVEWDDDEKNDDSKKEINELKKDNKDKNESKTKSDIKVEWDGN